MPSREKAYRVFVSYTGEDLSAHADTVKEVVRRLEWVAVDHRDWGARGTLSCNECKDTVLSCDILVVLTAHRYGWVPPASQGGNGETSITWWEVRWAQTAGLPVLAYLAKEDAPWPANKIDRDPRNYKLLGKFKSELRKLVVGFFSTPESLSTQLALNLPLAAKRLRPDPPPTSEPVPPPTPEPDPEPDDQDVSGRIRFARQVRRIEPIRETIALLLAKDLLAEAEELIDFTKERPEFKEKFELRKELIHMLGEIERLRNRI